MFAPNIEIVEQKEFVPREWLRRELVWTLVKVPRQEQIRTFINRTAWFVHSGNLTRVDTYTNSGGLEEKALAFFNQGKTASAFLTWSSLFKMMMRGDGALSDVNQNLKVQAQVIDAALATAATGRVDALTDFAAYEESRNVLLHAAASPAERFGLKQRLLRASKVMSNVAVNELVTWAELSKQHEQTGLGMLVISDGGTSRSKGGVVPALEPVFNEIINSEDFLSLNTNLT